MYTVTNGGEDCDGWSILGDDGEPIEGECFPTAEEAVARADEMEAADLAEDLAEIVPGPTESEPLSPEQAPQTGQPFVIPILFGPESDQVLSDSDCRVFPPGVFTWADLPLPLNVKGETTPGHDGAKLAAGRIDRIWRNPDNTGSAVGMFDVDEIGAAVAGKVARRMLTGISVDPRSCEVEEDMHETDDGWYEMDRMIFTSYEIGAATVLDLPGFALASIQTCDQSTYDRLAQDPNPQEAFALLYPDVSAKVAEVAAAQEAEPMMASAIARGILSGISGAVESAQQTVRQASEAALIAAGTMAPPREWFDNPALGSLSPLSLDDTGRLTGHLCGWETCHTGYEDTCVCAPHSTHDYAYFLTGSVTCADGERMAVGPITVGTGHAATNMSLAETVRHYDHSGFAVADVAVGEDEFGVWCSGRIRPGTDQDKVEALLASAPSGDWRSVGGSLELVAVLAVNFPGFPVIRARVASGGETVALTASGGSRLLAGRIHREHRPVTRAELDDLSAKVTAMAATVDGHGAMLGMLEPDVAERARQSL